MPPSSDVPGAGSGDRRGGDIAHSLVSAIVASSADAIIGKDLQGIITSWNKGAERLFGYAAEEIVGTSILRLVPADRHGEEMRILELVRRGERLEHLETQRLTRDGRLIHVSATISPLHDATGRIVGASKVARDITERKRAEREIARLSRLYAALSQINMAIICTPMRRQLFEKICQILVDEGGFRAVWVGWNEPGTHLLLPVARRGDQAGYIAGIRVTTDDRPEGYGPTGRAFRDGCPYICNDVWSDPATLPWRERLRANGWEASAAFPIRMAGAMRGTLTVYADETGFFQDKEIALLTEAAGDISFALDNFVREDMRRQAEQTVRDERDFTAALISSLPGILYLYDESGQFLRWNLNFQRITGYSDDEIPRMRPIDFIAGPDRALLTETIAAVFETGASGVEAGLLAKDGRVIPYYFTGVRTRIDGTTCLVGVGIDITERKQAERARQAAEDARREALANLARVARVSLLGEFAASVAHEINQPLAAIVTNGSAAMRWLGNTPPDLFAAVEAVQRIARDANRASDTIKKLRTFITREPPELALVDLNVALDEVLMLTQAELRGANVAVRADLADGLPPVRGDRVQLQQVMLNLVMNGIDAMKPVTDRLRVLHLRTGHAGSGEVCIDVEDSGTGFDAVASARLFEHFFTTKAGGMGLGLAISRGIVESHGGRLEAFPAVPHGARFRMTLPAADTAVA